MDKLVFRFLLPTALAVVWLTATVLLFFAGPAADDFCSATVSTLSTHFVQIYMTHAGRWMTVGFLVPFLFHRIELFSTFQHGSLMLALWVGYFIVFFFLFRVVTGASATWRTGLAAALLIGIVWWCGLPAPAQTIYWASAGLEYGLGFQAAAALFGAIALHGGRSPERGRALFGAALAVATFLVTGFHEIIALSVLGLLACMTAVAFFQRLGNRLFMLALTGVALIGTAVSVLAPGNAVRGQRVGGTVALPDTFYALYLDWFGRVVPWLTDPRLLCLSFLVLSSRQFHALQPRWASPVFDRQWWLIPVCALALVAGCLAVPALVLGQPGPARLHNFAYSIFVVGWFLTLFAAGRKVPLHTLPGIKVLRAVVGAIFVAAILFTGNMQDAISAVIGRNNAIRWHAWVHALPQAASRVRQQGGEELVLSGVPAGPKLFVAGFQRVPDRDPTNFINRCLAEYLGLSRLVVEQTEGTGAN